MPSDSDLRVLLYDIETAPMLAHIWQAKTEYVAYDFLVQDFWLLSWSAKWWGDTETYYSEVVTPKEAKRQDDARIVETLANLIREADIIVAHNGDSFDLPKLNARLVVLGLEPIGPKQTIDTRTLASKSFRLAYNKLDYLGEKLVGERKIDTGGFDLWLACIHGDKAALDLMLQYNEQDVFLLEKVFDRMLPYVKNLPRLVTPALGKSLDVCPYCGSEKRQRRGYHHTSASSYPKFQCTGCGRYHRSAKAEPRKLNTRGL